MKPTDPLPAEAGWYDVHYQTIQPCLPDWYEFMLPDLERELRGDSKLLEMGCGQGHLLRHLVQSGRVREENVHGVDQSKAAVEFVLERLPRAHIEVQDIRKVVYPECTFDFVFLMETIEHLEDPAPVLGKIHSVLKPGGLLYLSFPNYLHLPWLVVRVLAEKLNHPNWIVLQPIDKIYCVFEVARMVEKLGFRLERGMGSIYGPPLLYKIEPRALTKALNALGLYALSFHPILKFRKLEAPS